MQPLDIIILIIIAIPGIIGVAIGFLNILSFLLSCLLSLVIAFNFYPMLMSLLENSVNNPILKIVMAFIALFTVSFVLMMGVGFLLIRLLRKNKLTIMDRALGLFSGISFGTVIVGLIVFVIGFTPLPQELWWNSSVFVGPFEQAASWASQYLPEDISIHHEYTITMDIFGK